MVDHHGITDWISDEMILFAHASSMITCFWCNWMYYYWFCSTPVTGNGFTRTRSPGTKDLPSIFGRYGILAREKKRNRANSASSIRTLFRRNPKRGQTTTLHLISTSGTNANYSNTPVYRCTVLHTESKSILTQVLGIICRVTLDTVNVCQQI